MMLRSYQLHIQLKKNTSLTVGKLGTFSFPAGWYTYTGSAKRQIQNRVARHLSRNNKKTRWHIDYLLAVPHATIMQVTLTYKEECCLNQDTKGSILVPRFGSTDCTAGCGSHLKFSDREP